MTPAYWFFVLLVLSLASLWLAKKEESFQADKLVRARGGFLGLLGLGFCLYAFGLLTLYLYSFGEYEGSRLGSFQRYLGTYFLGWIVLFYYLLIEDLSILAISKSSKRWAAGILLGVFVLVSPAGFNILKIIRNPESRFIQSRLAVRDDYLYELKPFMKKPANYYLIWQQSSPSEMTLTRLELWPQKLINNTCWSLGKPYFADDFATCNLSFEEFEKRLKYADFVLMFNADAQFWNTYGKLFNIYEEDKNCRLFKRVKLENGHLQLIPIW